MPDKRNPTVQSLPLANYCPAIARAVNAVPSCVSHYHYPHLTDQRT